MDVVGQALAFGIRVTIWLFQWFFDFSTQTTYSSFGGLYRRSRLGTWVVVVIIWVVVWVLLLSLMQASNAALSGVVMGVIWAVILILRVQGVWEEDIAFLAAQEPQEPDVFLPPMVPVQTTTQEGVEEFDPSELVEKV